MNNSNKFLDLYPQLRIPKVGDSVKLNKSTTGCNKGTIGKVTHINHNTNTIEIDVPQYMPWGKMYRSVFTNITNVELVNEK